MASSVGTDHGDRRVDAPDDGRWRGWWPRRRAGGAGLAAGGAVGAPPPRPMEPAPLGSYATGITGGARRSSTSCPAERAPPGIPSSSVANEVSATVTLYGVSR